MKVLIGISQSRDDANQFCRQHLPMLSAPLQVGPFFSRKQALAWRKELATRIQDSEIIDIPESCPADVKQGKWYGFTFEEEQRER
jgi:hypothetical protein